MGNVGFMILDSIHVNLFIDAEAVALFRHGIVPVPIGTQHKLLKIVSKVSANFIFNSCTSLRSRNL